MVFEGTSLDVILHVSTILVSIFLFVLSLRAHKRKQNKKFSVIAIAFGLFAVKEALLTMNILYLSSSIVTGLLHVFNLAILGMFFYGVMQ